MSTKDNLNNIISNYNDLCQGTSYGMEIEWNGSHFEIHCIQECRLLPLYMLLNNLSKYYIVYLAAGERTFIKGFLL